MWSFPSPSRSNPRKAAVASNITMPAPTGGWYMGQNLAQAPPQTARILDNFFPDEDSVTLRGGAAEWATGMTGDVESLMSYHTGATAKLFAGNNGHIYDVSNTGAASSVVSGLSANTWQGLQFTTSGGTFLYIVNGTDTPQIYDGASWGTTPAITGVTPESLIHVAAYKNRLYFVKKNSMSVYYLAVDSIGGAATELALGGVFTEGGNILCTGSWSFNSGAGLAEQFFAVTDQGQVAIYQGTYPGDTATWGKVGIYSIPKPLGRDCLMKAGGDTIILTEDGAVPLSLVPQLDRIALASQAVTKNIAPEWRRAVQNVGRTGWSVLTWPKYSMAIVHVPDTATSTAIQYVANAKTGAWCRFTGWDVQSLGIKDNRLFYGTSDGRVMEAYSGGKDDDTDYVGICLWSFNDLKRGPAQKQVKAARLLYSSTRNAATALSINTNFDTDTGTPPSAVADDTSGAAWDSARWDVDVWPGLLPATLLASWETVDGLGATVAPLVQTTMDSSEMADLRLYQIDLVYESGVPIG